MEPDKKEELSEIKVNLDENNKPIVEEKKEEPKYVTVEELQKLNQAINNTREYTNRKQAEILAELKELRKPAQPAQPKAEPTEWDEKLQKNWKGTVEELADTRVKEILRQEKEQARMDAERARSFQLLEDNKRKVLERHKELNDDGSDKANIYKQVLSEHPEYLQNPFGPVLAMRDMEDRLKETGFVDEPTKRVVEKEVIRQTRANGGAIPKGSSNPNGSKTVTLTKEAKEFCDIHGIKYENYGKHAAMTANRGQVEA